ncbi:hypothetical protein [Beijerinckia sp. L45]|uniref:hypothetical protein n=1 Tax=Beijerinckia sp. L45 TaxID=1641855 RepID=UPI00131D992F|nr:hypothetical protein [Beijerinckia sp. L45]
MAFSKPLLTVLAGGCLFFAATASGQAAGADGSAGRMWTGSHHRMHARMQHRGNSTRSLENGTASGKGSGPHGGSPNG